MKTTQKNAAKVASTENKTAAKKEAVKVETNIKVSEVIPPSTPVHEQPPKIEKKDAPQEQPSKQEAQLPKQSLNDVIEKTNNRYELIQKLEKLQDTRKELSMFRVGDDGLQTYIRITDAQNRNFSTSNADLLRAVLQTSLEVIDTKISAVQAEILQ